MLDIFIKGGPVMYPLLLCSILAVAVGLERIWFLLRTRVDADELMDEMKLALAQGKVLEATQLLKRTGGPVAAVLAAILAHADRPRSFQLERVEQAGRAEVYRMERGLAVLDTVVTLAPLLGLLGTVTGIIRSFRAYSTLQGLETPAALSAGISEALITTAAGLMIAIPTMAVHNWIANVIDGRVQEMNRRATELVDLLDATASGPLRQAEGGRRR